MDENIVNQFVDELDPDEKLIWCGKPFPGYLFDRKDIGYFVPSRTFILLIPVLLIINNQTELTLLEIGIIIIILSIIGIPVLISLSNKLVIEPSKRRNKAYAITNQRIMIKSNEIKSKTRSIDLESIQKINVHLYRNGKGTIYFGNGIEESWVDKDIVTKFYFSKHKNDEPKLELVNDASNVFNLINKLQWKKKKKWQPTD
ncbi:MAG: hypothetical protein C0410_13125 [Anaerolinea sp.]|nr:hypothetical protein [Anaerolinea sp.]